MTRVKGPSVRGRAVSDKGWMRQGRPWAGRVGARRSAGLTCAPPSLPDSGYLFSGSRPPAQMSPSGEAPVSGKRSDGEAASGGALCGPGFPEGQAGAPPVCGPLCAGPCVQPRVQAWASN